MSASAIELEEPEQAQEIEIEALLEIGDSLIQCIFCARPIEEVTALIDEQDAPLWYQDESGNSALHAAAYVRNKELVDLLLQKGAVWNATDALGNTAGDVSLSLNDSECYRAIRDYGIRSEYLLSHLASKKATVVSPSHMLLHAEDDTPAGSTEEFLKSRLIFEKDAHGQDVCLVNVGEEKIGVMMGWERGIMQETVSMLCNGLEDDYDYSVLNVGFGLGIIDSLFQNHPKQPKQHYIIEAHPDVLQHMRELGWYSKSGVKILEGRWQDFIESDELLAVGGFDVVYTDTFSEDYEALRNFFDYLPDLLKGPEARFSFFNGLGATNALFYDVYTNLAELHLSNLGVSVTWSDVDLEKDPLLQDIWGGTRSYFSLRHYRLPIGQMSILS